MLKEGNKFMFAFLSGIIGAIARDIFSITLKLIGTH
jgi:hypothetical protein